MQNMKNAGVENVPYGNFLFSGEKKSWSPVFLLDILVNDMFVYSVSAETFFKLS